jgi:hypothetical protein
MAHADFPSRREDIERRVVRRAWADPAYLERLRDDPRSALEEELGLVLPARLRVTLVEEQPDHLCIVVPVDLSGINERDSLAIAGLGPRVAPSPPPPPPPPPAAAPDR